MPRWALSILLFLISPLEAQPGCAATPAWSACDVTFDLTPQEAAAPVEVHGEFRSPQHRTYLINAFREGNHLVLRYSPVEAGVWEYRLTSSLARLDGQTGQLTAVESSSPGFVQVANVHHFATADKKPHLWMSAPVDHFVAMPRAEFDALVAERAEQRFTHLRVSLDAGTDLNEAAGRIRAINAKGLTADLALTAIPPEPRARERYVAEIVARFCAFNITWAGPGPLDAMTNGRAVAKDIGLLIKKLDPYEHPRTSLAETTSAPTTGDAWVNLLTYGTANADIGSVEHQLFQIPAVNMGIRSQSDLWNATMNGQYPASGSGPFMKAWSEFLSQSRYWELEPYFDVDGGRAVALEGTEYLVYVERPALVELTVEDHSYEVAWMNPATGELVKGKDYKGEHFTGEPPDKSHDWVLRVSREGRKEGMLKSYKFDSRPVPVQEVEQNPLKTPFEIAAPEGDEISLSHPPRFALKIKRDTRATRSLLVEWTADVVVDGEGYRVAGTGREGTLKIPASIAHTLPGVVSLRMAVLNANGKAYSVDRVYRLVP